MHMVKSFRWCRDTQLKGSLPPTPHIVSFLGNCPLQLHLTEASLCQRFSTRQDFAPQGTPDHVRDIFDCHSWGLGCSGHRAGKLLTTLQGPGEPPQRSLSQPQTPAAPRLSAPALCLYEQACTPGKIYSPALLLAFIILDATFQILLRPRVQ